jgi:LmbE family N-acetylglucosaminyl deacetylase
MRFSRSEADVFVPAGAEPPAEALARVTHLCIAAHQDDIEIMAHAGISDCLEIPGQAFGGVIVTNGAGSPRAGPYSSFSDEQMQIVRRDEQRRAAELGQYAIQIQLAHPSADVKQVGARNVIADLRTILTACRPEVLYLHNPADKHDTHIAVLLRCLEALRSLRPEQQPLRVLGCEVWRDLDWMVDEDKVAMDAGRHADLARRMLAAFDSQVSGGKRYDLAALGRRRAHATFHTFNLVDQMEGITWAMDLTPLMRDPSLTVHEFTLDRLERFRRDVADRLARLGGDRAHDGGSRGNANR